MAANLDALLHLTQALESAQPAAKLRLDLVTRNAQPAGNDLQTDRGRAGAEHWIDAGHLERTFQPALARDRSFAGRLTRNCFGAK